MKGIIAGAVSVFIGFFLMSQFELSNYGYVVAIVMIVFGFAQFIITLKHTGAESELESKIEDLTKNLDGIADRLEQGEDLKDIAKHMKETHDIPEIFTIRYFAILMANYVETDLFKQLMDEEYKIVASKLALVQDISKPFVVNQPTFAEEIEDLDEFRTVFYMQQDVTLSKYGHSEEPINVGTGLLILTVNSLMWFPFKFDLNQLFRNDRFSDGAQNLVSQIPYLGFGVNSLIALNGFLGAAQEKEFFDQEKKSDLLEKSRLDDFLCIPIKNIKKIEFADKFRTRLTNTSFSIITRDESKYSLVSLNVGLELVDDLFDQIRYLGILNNNIFVPEEVDRYGKWVVWDVYDN